MAPYVFVSSYPPKLPLDLELCPIPLVKLKDILDCCDPLGGVAPGVDATDWDALNDPIRDCDMAIP